LPARLAKLHQPYSQAEPGIILACQQEAQMLAAILLEMIASKKTMLREIRDLFAQHPDREIYASLPGTGDYLQPALLAKFGDDRNRFPSASRVQALAGTCPVTISSGKRKQVRFRKSCDHEFSHIVQQWARISLRHSVWANTYYARIRLHCDSESHAFRCLANRWLAVLWRLWRDRKPYDETYHLKQRALRSQPRTV
jgi:transposase